MVWSLNSQGIKHCKNTEPFCQWLVHLHIDVCCCHVHFSWRNSEICVSLERHPISFYKLANLDWHFMEGDQHMYWAGWEWWAQTGLAPCYQKCSCKWNWWFFKAVPPNRLPFYMDSLLHIILIKPLLLVLEC